MTPPVEDDERSWAEQVAYQLAIAISSVVALILVAVLALGVGFYVAVVIKLCVTGWHLAWRLW